MPTNITPVATWTGTIPTPDDTEGATGAGLDGFAQALANREQWLYSVITGSGVTRVQIFADITDMKTSTPAGTGDVGLIPGTGFYYYDSAGVGPDDQPWTVEHDTGGLWTHENADLRDVEFPTLAAGKIAAAQIPNALINQAFTTYGTPNVDYATTTSGSFADTTALVQLTNVEVGDILLVDADIVGFADSTIIGYAQLAYEHNGSTSGDSTTEVRWVNASSTDHQTFHLMARKVVASSFSAGTPHIFKVQIKSNGADTVRLRGTIRMRMLQIRP